MANSFSYYYTWYHMSKYIIRYLLYNLNECRDYIIDKHHKYDLKNS